MYFAKIPVKLNITTYFQLSMKLYDGKRKPNKKSYCFLDTHNHIMSRYTETELIYLMLSRAFTFI